MYLRKHMQLYARCIPLSLSLSLHPPSISCPLSKAHARRRTGTGRGMGITPVSRGLSESKTKKMVPGKMISKDT
ncbi:hypothetical protein F4778DRAFT_757282 [Xylariomycetidae sp. FL2044]|nr:hypothetical protein F4778DRAFT_757282 [Xylariomycetidae sp. FL2044]